MVEQDLRDELTDMVGSTREASWIRAEVKDGRIDVTCLGIGAFELYLAPRLVDLAKPVEVRVNGAAAFTGIVKTDLRFMLEQALADEDRSLVYRARLSIDVPASTPPK